MPDGTQPTERLDWRLVIVSIVGLWLCYFALVTIRSWLLGWDDGWELFWRRGVVTGSGMVITAILWRVLRLFERRATSIKIIAALILALPVSIISAQINYSAFI